ncbi:hypothetical protein [Herbiconiux sp. YIM B11900]|uniref:hypothetical protein n=1 Tax=Herbiconiux sp. YIM B11900 TaxID=3404131 RepID=UPI003F8734B5
MRFTKILVAAVVVAAAATGLSACSSSSTNDTPSTPIGGDVITPVSMSANDLQGASVDLIVGQVLNIDTGDLATDSYTGEVADTEVAEFVQGQTGGSAELNPGVQALAVGTTTVTMINEQGGIQPLEFTVVVSEK